MPFPRSKLDAYLVFIDNCVNHEALLNQLHQWCVKGCVLEDGTMAESYKDFGFGSFHKLQIIESPRTRLFANHQGGYRVHCPNNDKIVTVDFVSGIAKWRTTQNSPEDIVVQCSACNEQHSLIEFVGKPMLAFGKYAFHFSAIESANINDTVAEDIEKNVGQFSLILKRVG